FDCVLETRTASRSTVFPYTTLFRSEEMKQMSTASNDDHWLKLITQCRSSGLTDRQWCIENGISVSTFYYHVRALRKKACEVPEADRKSTRLNSSHVSISYAVFCLKK